SGTRGTPACQPAVLLAAPGAPGAHRRSHRKDFRARIRRILPQPSTRITYWCLGVAAEPPDQPRGAGSAQAEADGIPGRRPRAPPSLGWVSRSTALRGVLAGAPFPSSRPRGLPLAGRWHVGHAKACALRPTHLGLSI